MTFGAEKFTGWAKSYSGFDGGNEQGNVWMCAIEYGGGECLEGDWDLTPIEIFPFVGADEERTNFIASPLNRNLTKIYAAVLGHDPAQYKKVYDATRAFDQDSDCCKLNLYPVAFKNVDAANWGERHYELTGFPTKSLYLAWCQTERFAIFKELAARNSPKVILAFGKTFWPDFRLAFGGTEHLFERIPKTSIPDCPEFESIVINSGRTILVLAPFPQRTLNSHLQIGVFGREIRALLLGEFGKIPLKHLVAG